MVRNNSVDIAKGIGIFLVIWAHGVCPIFPQISVFHMPLFFLLSGYVLNTKDNFKAALGKKIKSLLIPFAFFFVFQRIGFNLVAITGGTFKTAYLLPWYSIPPWRVMGVLWFIFSMFTVAMVYSLINKIPSGAVRFLICLMLTYTGFNLHSYNIDLPLHFGSSMSMMLFYWFGTFLVKFDMNRNSQGWKWALAGIVSLLVFLAFLNFYLPEISVANDVFEGVFFLNLALMIIGCITIFIISKSIDFIPHVNSWLAYIGRNSLVVFATHTVFLEAIYLVFPKSTVSYTFGILIALSILGITLLINIGLQKYFPLSLGRTSLDPLRMIWTDSDSGK
ncbi:MAG: acyltransferase family protein [Bacteroidota bacterium]